MRNAETIDPRDLALVDRLSDEKFFIETFCSIVDKRRVEVPFILNPPQAKYLANRTLEDLILKARKEGFSSLIRALWLHACIFKRNTRAVILSHDLDSTKRHFEAVRWTLDNLSAEVAGERMKFVVDLDNDSQKQLVFPQLNSSFWIGTAGSRAFGRGDDITHLHMSEVAHYQDQTILTGVLQACVPGAYKVMETTANGVGEAFGGLWNGAIDDAEPNGWKPHFFAWFEDPTNTVEVNPAERIVYSDAEKKMMRVYNLTPGQMIWYRKKKKSMPDPSLMPQEFPSNAEEAFLSSGRHLFNAIKLSEKLIAVKGELPMFQGRLYDNGADIEKQPEDQGPLKIWKMPRNGRKFLIAADSGKGVADGDWSVADVYDRASWEQVAQLRYRKQPGDFGRDLCTLGYFYNNAVLVPELNEQGWACVEAIKNEEYPHLLRTDELWKEGEGPIVEGFPTNQKTRSMILTAVRGTVEEDTIFYHSPVTLREMQTFVENPDNGKFEAQQGCHDDCVITAGIGAFCLKHLTVEETYATRAKAVHGSPLQVTSVTGSPVRSSSSYTGGRVGHRRRTGY